jgi:hypothetical protein
MKYDIRWYDLIPIIGIYTISSRIIFGDDDDE